MPERSFLNLSASRLSTVSNQYLQGLLLLADIFNMVNAIVN